MPRTDHPTLAELAAGLDVGAHPYGALDDHLAGCAQCRDTYDALRRADADVADVLRVLDDPAPTDRFDAVLAEARRRPRQTLPARHARGARTWRVGPIAAGALLVAGAAAALPHSPLRRTMERVLGAAPSSPDTAAPAGQAPRAPAAEEKGGAGIAMLPGERVDVLFRRPSDGRLAIRYVDGAQLSLRAQDADVAFTVRAGEIVVDDSLGRASFVLSLPRALRHLRVRVDSTTIFVTDASQRPSRADAGDLVVQLSGATSPRASPTRP